VVERVNVGNANLNITLSDERKRTSVEIERSLAPSSARSPTPGSISSPSRQAVPEGGGGGGRDITLNLGGAIPCS
jgi:hypothetical protein